MDIERAFKEAELKLEAAENSRRNFIEIAKDHTPQNEYELRRLEAAVSDAQNTVHRLEMDKKNAEMQQRLAQQAAQHALERGEDRKHANRMFYVAIFAALASLVVGLLRGG